MKKILFTIILASVYNTLIYTQNCGVGESEIIINVFTDDYAYETGWILSDGGSTIWAEAAIGDYIGSNQTLFSDTVCVPVNTCLNFTILDEFGDGICCGYGQGYYEVFSDGNLVAEGGEFGTDESTYFDCPPGSTCESAIVVSEGTYFTSYDNHWYEFTPTAPGTYKVSTCGLSNTCDTKIWIYEACGTLVEESNVGTIYYGNDSPGCGVQTALSIPLYPAETYYIRIGDDNDDCTGDIEWVLVYNGEIAGCTDPDACNYNPLATIADSTCIYLGDPGCTGPDLWLLEDVMENSIYLTTYSNNDGCAISEGCIQGYGDRDIVRFTTHIKNIGDLDYFIGDPSNNPDQFTYDNCHGHNHYDGYAEYLLYDENGVALPIGFKNGFCVMDLECSDGGTAQYGCGNMGISAGCGDIYGAGLDCQWIDVTDVADGTYTFVARTNWDNAPDAQGRYETDFTNNWAQVCINLDRSSGTLEMTVSPDCEPYVDCAGEIYGAAQPDCNGDCNGTALMGDLNTNGTQEFVDAQDYVTAILGDDITPTSCNDLNADNNITVYDAALLASCLNYGIAHNHPDGGAHDHCYFPQGINNIYDTVAFSIRDINYTDQYIDIDITNPTAFVNAYQFTMSGVEIASVENLVDPAVYPITPQTAPGSNMVIGISYEDSLILKSFLPQPLCRVYFMNLTNDEVCIETIVDVVNQDYENTEHKIVNGCLELVGVQNAQPTITARLSPNPFTDKTVLSFPNPKNQAFRLKITDATGRLIEQYEQITGTSFIVQRNNMESGVYFYHLENDEDRATGRLIVY